MNDWIALGLVLVLFGILLQLGSIGDSIQEGYPPQLQCQEDEAIWWVDIDTRGCVHMDVLCEGE